MYYKPKYIFNRILFTLLSIYFFSNYSSAEPQIYGPRFEIGLGGSGSRIQSRPQWSSKHYVSGTATFSCRIVQGLSLQIGKDLHYGTQPRDKWLDYGPHYQINTEKGTSRNAVWFGARYDIPLNMLYRKDILKVHTLYFAGGYTWDTYRVNSNEKRYYTSPNGWETGENPQMQVISRSYEAADLKGYYAAIGARWRIDTVYTEEAGSWIGAYGLDIGIRYTRYADCSPRYENIMKSGSNFNNYQLFIIGFIKFRLFY